MTAHPALTDPARHARAAGLLYLFIIVLGVSGEMLVRSALIVPNDAAATAANILADQGRFRLGLAADAAMAVCDVALAVLLYVLLRPVSATLALMAMAFRLIQTAILAVNLLNHNAALLFLTRAGEYGGLDAAQIDTLALVALETHAHGYDLGLIFFGVNCLILGYLLVRSAFLPRFIGPMIAAAGLVYLAGSALRFLAPDWSAAFAPAYAVPLIAETALCLWLLVRGVDGARWREQAALA